MANARNSGHLIGRLARDPYVSTNQDGSHTVLFTLMVDRNYTNAEGGRDADAISVEAFVPNRASSLGPFALIHQGDLVGVTTTLRQDHYTKSDGTEAFVLKVIAEDVTFLEPKGVTQNRLANRVAAAEKQNLELRQAAVTGPVLRGGADVVDLSIDDDPADLPF